MERSRTWSWYLVIIKTSFVTQFPENSNNPEKVSSSKYYYIEEMHNIEIPHKNKSLSLFHRRGSRNFWGLGGFCKLGHKFQKWLFLSNANNFSKDGKPGPQFHDKKHCQELKDISKKSTRYAFLPTRHIEPLFSRNEETVATMNRYFYCLMAYKELRSNIQYWKRNITSLRFPSKYV